MKRITTRVRHALPASALVLTMLASGTACSRGALVAPVATAPTQAAVTVAPIVPGQAVPAAGPGGYIIGAADVLSVVFWREKDLSVETPVRPDGKITLPLLNDLQAAGLTTEQLREQIQTAAAKYVEDPSVTVVVKSMNSRTVFITGQVARPGQYPLAAATTVLQLIVMAGGLQEYADSDNIVIMRTEGGQQVAMPFSYGDVLNRRALGQNIDLRPGDTVVVP